MKTILVNTIKAWLATHKISSHALAASLMTAAGLYFEEPQLKLIVDQFLEAHKSLAIWFTIATIVYSRYSKSQKGAL